MIVFVVSCLQKHLGTGEWMYRCLVEAQVTWSPLKFIILQLLLLHYYTPIIIIIIQTSTHVLVWIFNVTFCIRISPFCSRPGGSYSLYSKHLTRSEFSVPARGIAYANVTHNVIPLSIYNLQPVHLRSTRTIITQTRYYFKQRKSQQCFL